MEPVQLWAAVKFSARNGNTGALLSASAQNGLHFYQVTPQPGGFDASCAAWRYRQAAACARRQGVRLRVQKRLGLFFLVRPFLQRRGLWLGLLFFIPLLLWLQGLIWTLDTRELSLGQQARAKDVLWECDLRPGSAVTQEKLTAGEYALLQSGEFSWASLNFAKGRLQVEAAQAIPKPEIASGTLHGLRARCSGIVVRTNLVSGTMLVVPDQQVEEGQGLIGTARQERDGALIFCPAAGSVQAQFDWSTSREVLLEETFLQWTGVKKCTWSFLFQNHSISIPSSSLLHKNDDGVSQKRHLFVEILGFPLPVSMEETTLYDREPQILFRTEEQALAVARMQGLQALFVEYPDAEILARKEDVNCAEKSLLYTVSYTVIADICQ